MIDKRTWREFQEMGLFWWINRSLQVFGWTLMYNESEDGEITSVYPVKTSWRGFHREVEELGFAAMDKLIKGMGKVEAVPASSVGVGLQPEAIITYSFDVSDVSGPAMPRFEETIHVGDGKSDGKVLRKDGEPLGQVLAANLSTKTCVRTAYNPDGTFKAFEVVTFDEVSDLPKVTPLKVTAAFDKARPTAQPQLLNCLECGGSGVTEEEDCKACGGEGVDPSSPGFQDGRYPVEMLPFWLNHYWARDAKGLIHFFDSAEDARVVAEKVMEVENLKEPWDAEPFAAWGICLERAYTLPSTGSAPDTFEPAERWLRALPYPPRTK